MSVSLKLSQFSIIIILLVIAIGAGFSHLTMQPTKEPVILTTTQEVTTTSVSTAIQTAIETVTHTVEPKIVSPTTTVTSTVTGPPTTLTQPVTTTVTASPITQTVTAPPVTTTTTTTEPPVTTTVIERASTVTTTATTTVTTTPPAGPYVGGKVWLTGVVWEGWHVRGNATNVTDQNLTEVFVFGFVYDDTNSLYTWAYDTVRNLDAGETIPFELYVTTQRQGWRVEVFAVA